MLFPLSFYTYLLCPLLMGTDIWQEIEVLNQEFVRLGISQSVDYEKYYLYSLITHSTAIEGSTLTELDTQLLFDEGVTAKGKPLVYHLMNEDLKKAYELAKEESAQNAEVTPVFLQKLNAALMRTTGSVYNVMGGSFDSSKGEFRLCGVTAGVGGCSYMPDRETSRTGLSSGTRSGLCSMHCREPVLPDGLWRDRRHGRQSCM